MCHSHIPFFALAVWNCRIIFRKYIWYKYIKYTVPGFLVAVLRETCPREFTIKSELTWPPSCCSYTCQCSVDWKMHFCCQSRAKPFSYCCNVCHENRRNKLTLATNAEETVQRNEVRLTFFKLFCKTFFMEEVQPCSNTVHEMSINEKQRCGFEGGWTLSFRYATSHTFHRFHPSDHSETASSLNVL